MGRKSGLLVLALALGAGLLVWWERSTKGGPTLVAALSQAGYQVVPLPGAYNESGVQLDSYIIPLGYVGTGETAGWDIYVSALSQSGYTPEEIQGYVQAIKPLWDTMWVALKKAGYGG